MKNSIPAILAESVNAVNGNSELTSEAFVGLDPSNLKEMYASLGILLPGRRVLAGTYDQRVLIAESESAEWYIASLHGSPLSGVARPDWAHSHLLVENPGSHLSRLRISADGIRRLFHPRLLLVALYHRETFPLPRFPLGISDVARAARSTWSGNVEMLDMQLGVDMEEIEDHIASVRPDIVGISATFGQHDLMIELLDHTTSLLDAPITLAGGSLTARNEKLLLERYRDLLIARGAGETTIIDTIAYYHGDIGLSQVRGIGYRGSPRGGGLAIGHRPVHNPTVANRDSSDIFPELDLLGRTFEFRGVAQLETSRGCTNFCSFCPRGHKGMWSGSSPDQLGWLLTAMSSIFDRHPDRSRTIYLVDEEFLGDEPDSVDRAVAISKAIYDAGFRWESSCRIDQVVDPVQSRQWHVERASMWRTLIGTGLRRMLFGVESGVSSVLTRFNKETTGEQNALAIRTLSALGVPTRFTYITFDHLMDLDELRLTADFQGRTDLLLRPLPELSVEDIVDGVRDPEFIARHAVGTPLYAGISYLLVSMECLIGSAYTRQVEAAGLVRSAKPAMGTVEAEYADRRIGIASHYAQLWVDRNFAFDYTLKSLEKILDGEAYGAVRRLRRLVKSAAFEVLVEEIAAISNVDDTAASTAALDAALAAILDRRARALSGELASTVDGVSDALPPDTAAILQAEYQRWQQRTSWELINQGAAG